MLLEYLRIDAKISGASRSAPYIDVHLSSSIFDLCCSLSNCESCELFSSEG